MKRKCDVCKKKLAGPILSLGNQPLCDDLHSINSNKKPKVIVVFGSLYLVGKILSLN